jgi:Zn-dependent protease with chaperone function
MNFFERQHRARTNTRLLVLFFALALISIVAVVDLVVLTALALGTDPVQPLFSMTTVGANASALVLASVLTGGAIGLASLLRIITLRSGGGAVARGLGGVLVSADTPDPHLQRLRNVVEEMSIASGVPVPEIYVLEKESGINAFAAGYSPADAAIAVTRGALQHLNRAELQGVVAHEFSHILNGDMRLNIRLIGLLFGILVLALIGRVMISVRHSRASKETVGIAVVGLVLVIVGYIGLFFGRLIRAAVSRQREFLADASAVQFTREPDGLAGALKTIAATQAGSRLSADSEEIGHMLFAAGLSRRLLSTHPPLVERIRAIEPSFDPGEIEVLQALRSPAADATASDASALSSDHVELTSAIAPAAHAERTPDTPLDMDAMVARIGRPDPSQVQAAARLTRAIPEPLARAARSQEWVAAVICYLLVDSDPEIREQQLLMVSETLGAEDERQTHLLLAEVPQLADNLRIPLVEIAFPTLRRRPASELDDLVELIDRLAHVDGRIDVFEYVLARLLSQHIEDALIPSETRNAGTTRLASAESEVRDLLLIVAAHGGPDQRTARAAFAAGLAALHLRPKHMEPIGPTDWPDRLDQALGTLDSLGMTDKERVLHALVATVKHAGVTTSEIELIRAIVAALHVPMPVIGP